MRLTKEMFGSNFSRWDDLLVKYASETAPFFWLKNLMMIESTLGMNSRVARGIECPEDIEGSKSEDGKSWGLLQLRPSTARDYDPNSSAVLLNDPEYSIMIGSKHLHRLFMTFNGEEQWVIKSYNQGEGNSHKELSGLTDGYAGTYWAKYLKNRAVLLG